MNTVTVFFFFSIFQLDNGTFKHWFVLPLFFLNCWTDHSFLIAKATPESLLQKNLFTIYFHYKITLLSEIYIIKIEMFALQIVCEDQVVTLVVASLPQVNSTSIVG